MFRKAMKKRAHSFIGYFDPNTYGVKGYSFIGPLLLFYDALIIYGPVSKFIELCYSNPEYHNTALAPDEFVNAILAKRIVPLGFVSFFDEAVRSEYQKPELRICTSFDKDLMNPFSALGSKVFRIPNDFKENFSPVAAKEIVHENRQKMENNLIALADNNVLPKRYQDFLNEQPAIPKGLKETLPGLNHLEMLPYLIIYDFLNNKYVMAKQGTSKLHVQHFEFQHLYHLLHGFVEHDKEKYSLDSDIKLSRSELSHLINKALMKCVSRISYGRLTYEEINNFLINHRDDFINSIKGIILKIQSYPSPYAREEEFIDLFSIEFREFEIYNRLSIANLMEFLLSKLGLFWFSDMIFFELYDRPGTIRNKIYHLLKKSFFTEKNLWIYQFLKEKK